MKKNKNKINIAIMQPSLTAGGVEKVLVNLLNSFDYSLFNVDLFLLKNDDFFFEQINKNVNVIFEYNNTNKKRLTLKELLLKFRIFSALKVVFFFFISLFYKDEYIKKRIILKAYPKISKKKYKAVICYNGVSKTLLKDTIFNIKAKKRIAWIHGNGYEHIPVKLYSFFDKIYCVSKGVKNDFDSYFPSLIYKTSVFYNILNKEEIISKANMPLQAKYKCFSILTVARLSQEKGVMLIPNIVEKLKKEKYCFKWLLIGDGPLSDNLKKAVKNKGIENELILLGPQDNPYNYMKMCDLYVQPSLSEGYCTTTSEAKLLCRPILVTNVNGMNEQFINGETAVIVDKPNVDTLFLEIKKMISDSTFRHSLSQNLEKSNSAKNNCDVASLLLYLKK